MKIVLSEKIEEHNREDWYLLLDRLNGRSGGDDSGDGGGAAEAPGGGQEIQEADINRVFDLIVKQAVWADAWIVPLDPPLGSDRYND